MLQSAGLQILAPQIGEEFFDDWWEKVILAVGGQLQKGLNSLVILGVWTIWNHRGFDVVPACLTRALLLASEELQLWGLARAKGILYLFTQSSL